MNHNDATNVRRWRKLINDLQDGNSLLYHDLNLQRGLHCENRNEHFSLINELSQVVKTTNTLITRVALENYHGLSNEAFRKLICLIGDIDTLECLRIYEFGSNLSLSDDIFGVAVGDLVKANNSIKDLNLSGNSIRDALCNTIVDSMKYNNTIKELNLAFNEFGDDGCVAIAEALKNNNMLKNLNIGHNIIGDIGCIAIAEMLKLNNTIEVLIMNYNEIGDCGCMALAKALELNNALVELTIDKNNIGDKGAVAQGEMLKKNNTLLSLDLGRNEMGNNGFVALSVALKHNNALKSLYYGGNLITEVGITTMCAVLRGSNFSLRHLIYDGEDPEISLALQENREYCCQKFIRVNMMKNLHITRDQYINTMIRGCQVRRYSRIGVINILYKWMREDPCLVVDDQYLQATRTNYDTE